MKRWGLNKLAEDIGAEVMQPDEDKKETVATCLSDCMYAQNPEKRCMLEAISLNMTGPGQFECGQYAQQQAMMPGQMPGQMPGPEAPSASPLGLAKQAPQPQSQPAPPQSEQPAGPKGLDKAK